MGSSTIATNWKSLSGENNWDGLLDPLDIDLRKYLIHYGERVEAIIDGLIVDKASPLYLFDRFPMNALFSCVGLEIANPYKYQVTKYIYAVGTLGDIIVEHTWIGYVAVSTDEGNEVLGRRDILIAWRGTIGEIEGIIDVIEVGLVSASDIFGDAYKPKVHSGWHSLYTVKNEQSDYNKTSAREQVLSEVRRLVDKYGDEETSITVTGHSMGAAIATLNAMDIVANGYNKPTGQSEKSCMVTAIVFASPRMGDEGFKDVFSGLTDLHVLRITNAHDVVPKVPASIPIVYPYTHVGLELVIDTHKSPFMRTGIELVDQAGIDHQLEGYLHGIAGTHGNGDFELVINRDLALLSKGTTNLRNVSQAKNSNVPLEWWSFEKHNKGMIQQKDGTWKLYVPPPVLSTVTLGH